MIKKENLQTFLNNCYDSLGILLVLCINQQNFQIMKSRNIFFLDQYFENIKTKSWNRCKYILDLNIESLKKIILSNSLLVVDTKPHFVNNN